MQSLIYLLIFLFGSALGSFLNVVILRLPKEQKLTGRSRCNNCGRTLGALDLIPLFSYLFLRGKCRYCKHKISPRYFVIEAITGILLTFAYAAILPQALTDYLLLLKVWIVICVSLVTFVVDLENFIILSGVVLPFTLVMIFINFVSDLVLQQAFTAHSLFVSGILGAILGALPIFILWYASKWKTGESGSWMGFGDVELMLFLGAAVGVKLVGVVLFIAIISGGFISVILLASGKKTLKSRVPFGVFLTLAAVISLFFGSKILSWYLALLGF